MADSSYGNAMTEIALALAMAFFSIMVLTMVSMSATPNKSSKNQDKPALKLARNDTNNSQSPIHSTKRQLVIFWNGQFMDHQLSTLKPETFNHSGRMVLALPPDLPMTEALAARARFGGANIVVSTLDARWLKRMRQFDKKETPQ